MHIIFKVHLVFCTRKFWPHSCSFNKRQHHKEYNFHQRFHFKRPEYFDIVSYEYLSVERLNIFVEKHKYAESQGMK